MADDSKENDLQARRGPVKHTLIELTAMAPEQSANRPDAGACDRNLSDQQSPSLAELRDVKINMTLI